MIMYSLYTSGNTDFWNLLRAFSLMLNLSHLILNTYSNKTTVQLSKTFFFFSSFKQLAHMENGWESEQFLKSTVWPSTGSLIFGTTKSWLLFTMSDC